MAIEAAALLARVGADTSDAESKMQAFSGRLDSLASSFGAALLKHDLIRLATDALLNLGKTALDSYADNERLGQSLDTLVARELRQKDAALSMSDALVQAAPKAQELLKWNTQLAINSPFTEQGVAQTFRMVEAYGFISDSADKAAITSKRLTQDIVDFVAGSGRSEETASRLALALGQIQARGSLAGQEVRQLTEAGVAVDQVLAKAFGKSTTEIVALREKGLIPADAAIQAIVQSLESDFSGAAQRQAGTVTGLLNSLQDLQRIGARDILGPAFQAAQPYIQKLVDTLQSPEARQEMQQLGQAIGTLAGEAIPQLIQAGGDAVRMVESIGEAGQPVFQFLGENATPIVYGLAAAYTLSLVPALTLAIPALAAAGVAATVAAAPFVALGALIAVAKYQFDQFQAEAASVTDKILAGNAAYQNGTKALADYNQASETTQALTKEQADQLTRWQSDQRAAISLLAQHTAEYETFGRASGSTAESLQLEKNAINVRTEAMQRSSGEIERAIAFQQLMAADSGGWQQGIERTTGAAREQGLVLQQTAEQAAKYQAELTKIGTAGAAAASRLQESQTQFAEAEASRLHDHQEQLSSIAAAGERQRLDTKRTYQTQHAAAEQQYAGKLADIQRGAAERQTQAEQANAGKLADIQRGAAERQTQAEQQESDRQTQAATQLSQKLADIQQRSADLTEQFQQQRQDRLAQHQDRIGDITRTGAQQAADAEQRSLEQRQQAEQQYTDRAAALIRQLADVQEQADEQLADRQRALSERSADRARALADRIADIQQQATDRAADAQQRYADDTRNKAEDHQDKLADLQERLGEATTDAQRAAIQRQIAQENERYAKTQQRAQEAYARAQQEAAEAAQRDIERAQQAAAREEAKAQEQAAREEAKAAEQLARQQRHIAEQQALLDQAYAADTAKAAEKDARDKAARDAALAQRLADEQAVYARSGVLAQQKYDGELRKLAAQTTKEQQEYTAREAQAAAHWTREQADRDAALAQQLADTAAHYTREQAERDTALARQTADLADAYAHQLHDLTAHYRTQRTEQATALATRLAAENKHYADQEESARTTQARQEADLKLALGKQLAAYVDTQQAMTTISAAEASKRRQIIAAEYGADPAAEQQRFGAILASILGTPGGGGGARSPGSNTPIGPVTINVNGAGDPQAVAQAVRNELIRTGRRNQGLGGVLGGV